MGNLHYQTCLPSLALTPRAYLFLHTLSGLLPMFTQACSLGILRLTTYVWWKGLKTAQSMLPPELPMLVIPKQFNASTYPNPEFSIL